MQKLAICAGLAAISSILAFGTSASASLQSPQDATISMPKGIATLARKDAVNTPAPLLLARNGGGHGSGGHDGGGHGEGGHDGGGHDDHGRGSHDGAGHDDHARGADDDVGHIRHGHGADDAAGEDNGGQRG